MDTLKHKLWLPMIVLTGFLAACGGGGSSSGGGGDTTTSTGISVGIAVDPYIVNAQFEELAADGQTVIQRSSSSSSAKGEFSFPNTITDGSFIRMKVSTRGQHANAPFTGIIKRRVFAGDQQPAVVSPLTTLMANGMSPTAIIQAMNNAGLPGLNEAHLYADPMAPLLNKSDNVTEADLVPLQANMAANAFMEATLNFDYNGSSTANPPVSLADMAKMVKETLNPNLYQQMANTIGAGFTVGDLAETAATLCRTVVSQIRQEIASGSSSVPAATIDQFMLNVMVDTNMIAGEIYQRRTGTGGSMAPPADPSNEQGGTTPDPGTGGTTPPPTNPPNGQVLFSADCSGCHTVGASTGIMDLAGDGAKVSTRFASSASHNGRTLAADEMTAVADFLNGQGGTTPDPGTGGGSTTPPSGSDLYTTECQGCHGSLQTSDIGTRTSTGIQAAINANLGGMGSLVLSTTEIQAIADALAAVTPPTTSPTPPQDRTGQQAYDQECAICHSLGTHDASGTIDLAGTGALIATKIQGGHNNRILTSTELSALAAFADTFAPAAGGGGSAPVTGACDSCHGQPPSGSSFPNMAGAHGVHTGLPGIGTVCDNCHTGGTHNSWVDLGFPAKWNAKSGAAIDNLDGTCSNISCHGGQNTPEWTAGTINVDTQCRSCHTYGTTQYNSYVSGEHRKHVTDKGLNCVVCHDTAKLQSGHFGNLSTAAFEQNPSATIKTSLSYNGGTCQTPGCHGSKSW